MAGEPLKLTYRVRARRVGRDWELDVPGFADVIARGRDLKALRAVAAGALAEALQVPAGSFELVVDAG